MIVDVVCENSNCPDRFKCARNPSGGVLKYQPFQKVERYPLETDDHRCSRFLPKANAKEGKDQMRSDRESTPVQKAYGKGRIDGLRLAGIEEPETYMNAERIRIAEQNLNGIARKIYEHVPAGDAVKAHLIISSMSKATGSTADHRVVMSCLKKMVDERIVREPSPGEFCRTPKREIKESEQKPATKPEPKIVQKQSSVEVKPEAAPASPMDRFAALAQEARKAAEQIINLASKLDDAAIEVEQSIQAAKQENAKMVQLKELLKSLS
ncbi:hypothetical protein [Panacagrimonas sp.]|uniref:hypothetical protein n=1 Tax=Panacagrimonas sp. TaxID=2480088 RepID=UPI003B5159A5